MNYIDLNIRTNDSEQSEIFIAQLSDWPFDSFDDQEGVLHAYIRETDFAACREEVENLLQESGASFGTELIADRNWNEVWESNFEPIEVEGRCAIRAPFHVPRPDLPFDIVIMPKMAFGTGHHATTQLMVEEILDMPLDELCGLDMGSGTAVLSILAVKKGAARMDAIDIDQWAYANSRENIAANGLEDRITPRQGDASLLAGRRYDFVLANINRNILLADMPAYAAALVPGGDLVMSGFLEADTAAVTQAAAEQGMETVAAETREGWMMIRVKKKK